MLPIVYYQRIVYNYRTSEKVLNCDCPIETNTLISSLTTSPTVSEFKGYVKHTKSYCKNNLIKHYTNYKVDLK